MIKLKLRVSIMTDLSYPCWKAVNQEIIVDGSKKDYYWGYEDIKKNFQNGEELPITLEIEYLEVLSNNETNENIRLFDSDEFNKTYPNWHEPNSNNHNKYDNLPLGVYIIFEGEKFVSIHNLEGYAWTEEHNTLEEAVVELRGE